jgi:multidrug resistance efflux pump
MHGRVQSESLAAIPGIRNPAEQQADFDAATAALAAAEAQLRVAQATFDRQSNLLSSGFTTRVGKRRLAF